MFSFRSLTLFSFAAFCWGAHVSAQNFPVQSQPTAQQRVQQIPMQQQRMQQQSMQVQPIQSPPFGTQGGTSVYQQNPNVSPAAQPTATQTSRGTGAVPMNVGQPTNQPMQTGQSIRVATSNAAVPVSQGPQILYDPSGANHALQTAQPVAQGVSQGVPQGMEHVGRAEPANRIVPFWLKPEEQRELDQFLALWEEHSVTIKRYDVDFNLFIYDPTIPGAPQDKPYKTAYGYFKYNAEPRRFVYAVEGEWVEGEWQGRRKIKRDDNNHVFAEKIIIDDKSVYQYDYTTQTVRITNVPPDMIGKGIADSPLPLIFGAKADDLKRRFSMRIVPIPGRDDVIWLHARPFFIEDQQEFRELEILFNKNTLTALGLKQWDINGKSYRTFELNQPRINPRLFVSALEYIKVTFTPDTPRGWTREEENWVPPPSPAPAVQQPRFADPSQPQHGGVPLYRAQ